MKLTILSSSSKGNGYILHNDNEALIIEAGVRFKVVQKALDFNTSKIVGCIVTHEHGDHSGHVSEYLKNTVKVFTSRGTIEKLKGLSNERKPVAIASKQVFQVGNFRIMPFDVIHDAKEPFGYIIDHLETGKILFLTDTHYSKYVFKHINHYIIEANYVEEIVDNLINCGKLQGFRYDRIYNSHMSLETCKKLLQANDLSQTNNIILIHLSDSHSDEKRMKREIIELTGKMVHVAKAGLEVELKKEIV